VPNSAAAILQASGEMVQIQATCLNSSGIMSGQIIGPYQSVIWPNLSITDTVNLGIADAHIKTGTGRWGAHTGSFMSAFGGAIRQGEMLGDSMIRHAIRVSIDASAMYYDPAERGMSWYRNDTNPLYGKVIPPGAKWPAAGNDGDAWDYNHTIPGSHPYTGTDPDVKMGALLTLPWGMGYSENLADKGGSRPYLKTTAAKKIFWAMVYYGAYVVDDSFAPGLINIMHQQGVDEEMVAKYGHSLVTSSNIRDQFGQPIIQNATAVNDYKEDLKEIFRFAQVVTNNSASTIGGGTGQRRTRPAPAFLP
jgi:hypothetical protein